MAAHPLVNLDSLLVVREGVRFGKLCLRGTRITVLNVAAHYSMGVSVAEMCADNPDLDPSLFYAAAAYYLANKERVEAELEMERIEGARLAAKYPNGITSSTFAAP